MTSEERLHMAGYLHRAMAAVEACHQSMRLLEVHDLPHALHMLRFLETTPPGFEAPRSEHTKVVSMARSIEALEAAKMLWYFAQLGEHWRVHAPVHPGEKTV